ncbi:LamG domain-containing protein [archaeon]|jgi:hypothetical protein|nr:LamG domain-containing protein [archaeon]MBT6606204.1 LamG domain-containing protein [archaeon]MBT7251627.1 LamG domain-containing protein [archaeon]MBT7661083.1 LamG domain-containing protein [archaeon]
MSYEKFVIKKGKKYGPYIYESYRDSDGHVKKRYLGKGTEKKKSLVSKKSPNSIFPNKKFSIFLIFGLLIFGLLIFGLSDSSFSDVNFFSGSSSTGTGQEVDFFGTESFLGVDVFSDFSSLFSGYLIFEELSDSEDALEESEEEVVEESEDSSEPVEESLDDSEGIDSLENELDSSDNESVEEILEEEPSLNETSLEEGSGAEDNQSIEEDDLVNETISESVSVGNISLDDSLSNETSADDDEINNSLPLSNETLENVSLTNNTLIGNVTVILKEIVENTSTTLQYRAVIGRPVKWVKKVNLDVAENVTLEIPLEAENISVLTGIEVAQVLDGLENDELAIEEIDREEISAGVLTGYVSYETSSTGSGVLTRFWNWFIQRVRISGNVISEVNLSSAIITDSEVLQIDLNNVSQTTDELAIEYYTAAPEAIEINIPQGKRIIVSANDSLNYTEVLAFVDLEGHGIKINDTRLRLYWYPDTFDGSVSVQSRVETLLGKKTISGERIPAEFVQYDFDNDGFLDYIEWVVPHLSAQTYEIIIEIIAADHLDSNRTFISNIYNETFTLDDVWSEPIFNGEYVRVTFEKPLASWNDITVFSKSNSETVNGSGNSNMTIEVYLENGTEVITSFPYLNESNYTKVLLTGMLGSHNTFDLKIISLNNETNSSLIFDHIIDPSGVPGEVSIDFEYETTLDDGAYTQNDFLEVTVNTTDNETSNNLSTILNYDNSVIDILRFDTDYDGSFGTLSGVLSGGSISDPGRFGSSFLGTGVAGSGVNYTLGELNINPNDEFSVSLWFRREATVHGWLVSEPNTAQRSFDVFMQNSVLKFRLYDGRTTLSTLSQEGLSANDGGWHHLVAVYDGSTAYLYLDGMLNKSAAASGVKSAVFSDVFIGRTRTLTIPWDGDIDDVVLYNRSIAYEEVVMLFNGTNMTVNFTGLGEGLHTLKAYGTNTFGDLNETVERTVGIDFNNPVASFFFDEVIGTENTTIKDSFAIAHGVDSYEERENLLFFSGEDNFTNVTSFISVDDDIFAWYRMEENNATGIQDYFGNYNGSTNGEEIVSSGRFGKGLKFTAQDYVEGVNFSSATFNDGKNFTVSVWFKNSAPTLPDNNYLFSYRDSSVGSNDLIDLYVDNNEQVVAKIYGGSSVTMFSGGGSVGDTEWHNVVVTGLQGTTMGSYQSRLYLDGVEVDTGASTTFGTASNKFYIGKRFNGNFAFDGIIDDVLLIKRTLTDGEVQSLYANATQLNTTTLDEDFITNGIHNYTTYTQDLGGNVNWTNESLLHNASLIMACRDLGVPGRNYWLVENISSTGDCITFNNSNQVLFLNGTNLYGSSLGSGVITNPNFENSTIYGGIINGFAQGILNLMNFTRIDNVTVIGSAVSGIAFQESNHSFLSNISVRGSPTGINYSRSNGNYLYWFNSSASSIPLYVHSSSNNTLIDGFVDKAGLIDFGGSGGVLVWGVTNGSSNNTFENITFTGTSELAFNDTSIFTSYNVENSYINNTIPSTFDWDYYFENSSPLKYNFSGNSIEYSNEFAGVKFYNESIVASGDNFSSVISLASNNLTVDSTNNPEFNYSGQVTLKGLGFSSNIYPIVDFNDDTEYETCTSGDGICTNVSYSSGTFIYNVSHFTTYSSDDDLAPLDPEVTINFEGPNNWTNETIYCNSTIIDPDDTKLISVNVSWYEGSSLLYTAIHSSEGNNTVLSSSLLSGNTSKGYRLNCRVQITSPGWGAQSAIVQSSIANVLNYNTTLTPTSPANNSETLDRTPYMNWSYYDLDGDIPSDYELNITAYQISGGAACSDSQLITGISTNFTLIPTDLACLHDNGYQYRWKVQETGVASIGWSDEYTFNVTGVLDMTLTNSEINFTSLDLGDSNDTIDDSPLPFVIENTGTVILNISMNSTFIWESDQGESTDYQFKVDNTSELGSFDWTSSATNLIDTRILEIIQIVSFLKYADANDEVEVDISLTVPSGEPPGLKQTEIIYTGVLAE